MDRDRIYIEVCLTQTLSLTYSVNQLWTACFPPCVIVLHTEELEEDTRLRSAIYEVQVLARKNKSSHTHTTVVLLGLEVDCFLIF